MQGTKRESVILEVTETVKREKGLIFKMLNVKSSTWCASQRKPRGARLQVFSGHGCPVTGEKTVLLGLESGFR